MKNRPIVDQKLHYVIAILWLIIAISPLVPALFSEELLSMISSPETLLDHLGMAEIFALLAPIMTVIMIWITHKVDEKFKCWGVGNKFDRIEGSKYHADPSFVSMAITKQSIFSAIALGLLVFVVSTSDSRDDKTAYDKISAISSKEESRANGILVGGIARNIPAGVYSKMTRGATVLLLTASLLLSLVSVLCYDYSQRFNWGRPFKVGLLKKGLKLDIYSWYALTSALVYCSGILHALFAILVNAVYGILLLSYYFPNKYCQKREKIYCSAVDVLKRKPFDQCHLTVEDVEEVERCSSENRAGTILVRRCRPGTTSIPPNWVEEVEDDEDDEKDGDDNKKRNDSDKNKKLAKQKVLWRIRFRDTQDEKIQHEVDVDLRSKKNSKDLRPKSLITIDELEKFIENKLLEKNGEAPEPG